MSQPAIAVEPTSRSIAILGADALLVALPSTPTQLANACFAGGFAEVFPATWGDELIAAGCLEGLESRTGPAIFCSCPLVAEQLRGAAELRRFIVPLISPPVAIARYLRALYAGDALTITYIGDCPGADDESIDEHLSPYELLDHLARRGILPATQRPDLGTHAARDRRRFYSLPGGAPSPQWLAAQWPKRTLVDVHAVDALASLANQTLSRGNTLIDFAPHLGCACAGAVGGSSAQDARNAVVALEPPRAQREIVSAAVRVEVSLAPAGERQLADVTWGDFLAALPAALAMPADGAHAAMAPESRTAARRVRERKVTLPRAYMAARQLARRDRTGPTPARAEPAPAPLASHEGRAVPRGNPLHRAPLAPSDRWLLAGLVLAGSCLVAVLTSVLTVSGMQRSGESFVDAHRDTVSRVASAPAPVARDSMPAAVWPSHAAVSLHVARHPLAVAEHARVVPPALAPPRVAAPAAASPPAVTPAATAAAPAAAQSNNTQFLEELRAIHAEIDARKRRMDSLTSSLDSLRKVSPPR